MLNETSKISFLADECVRLPTIVLLRNLGHSVVTAREAMLGGKSDPEILKLAIKRKMVLVTEDLEFGNIILYPPKTHHGIILLRFRHSLEEDVHNVLTRLLIELKPDEFDSTLVVVDHDKYRIRRA